MKIQFGSGGHIKKNFINVDYDLSQGADIACDMEKFPYPFEDNSADFILCEMVLEHIKTPTKAINEFHRIIKPEGIVKIVVPHFTSAYALSADIHITTFNIGYFWQRQGPIPLDMHNRALPLDGWRIRENEKYWKNVKVELFFPKGNCTILSLPWQFIFGKNKRLQGIYENLFSLFYRANEIHITYQNKC
jgi:SAM-dependent methyltransferase